MIPCGKGAILNDKDLATLQDALQVALADLEAAFDGLSNNRHPSQRAARTSVRRDLKRYKAISDSLDKCLVQFRMTHPRRGTCRVCGCTEQHACLYKGTYTGTMVACSWIDETETLCTNPKCVATVKKLTPRRLNAGQGPSTNER